MILIRTDANSIVATGHLMRCLSLADALKEYTREDIVFCMADKSGVNIVKAREYRVIMADGCWDDLTKEKESIIRIIKENNVSLLIVDSYYVSAEYFEYVSSYTKTVYIDDRNAEKYKCDLLVNYSVYAKDMGYYELYKESQLLLGSQYAPLRKQFDLPDELIDKTLERRRVIKRILVTTGASDPYHAAEKIISGILNEPKLQDYRIAVVKGRYWDKFGKDSIKADQLNRVVFFENIVAHIIAVRNSVLLSVFFLINSHGSHNFYFFFVKHNPPLV